METKPNDKKQKKGLLAAIWESMTKTGGCCGSGGNCCGPSDPNNSNEKAQEKKVERNAEGRNGS
jgi:hypothetical protein